MTEPTYTRLPDRGAIEVTGSDRVRWIDGMVTQDIAAIADGSFAYALVLTHQGRIVSDAWIGVLGETLWLDLERAAVAPTIGHLDKFIIADDVVLSDASDRVRRIAIEGAGAIARAASVPALSDVRQGGFALVEAEGVQLFIAPERESEIAAALAEAGIVERTPGAFERRRIALGVPWYGRELDDSVLPAETGLDHAVSTTKGCYAGQEVVARMRSRDRVASKLVSLRVEGDAQAGGRLQHEGKRAGELTSLADAAAADGFEIGLGYVKTAFADPGTALEGEGFTATVCETGSLAEEATA